MKRTELMYQEVLLIRRALEEYADQLSRRTSSNGDTAQEANKLEQWIKSAWKVVLHTEEG